MSVDSFRFLLNSIFFHKKHIETFVRFLIAPNGRKYDEYNGYGIEDTPYLMPHKPMESDVVSSSLKVPCYDVVPS